MLGANVIIEGYTTSLEEESFALELARSITTSCQVVSRMLVHPAT